MFRARSIDVLGWAVFARQDARARLEACLAAVKPAVQEARARAVQEAIALLHVEPPVSPPAPAPGLVFDANGETPVVVVTRELKEGETLAAPVLEIRRMPRALVTPSVVPESALAAVTGALAVVPLEPGDVLRWQFLDDPATPRSLGWCMTRAASARQKAADVVGEQRVRVFFQESGEGP